MRITWRPAAELSIWHAALAVAHGEPLVNGELAEQLGRRLAALPSPAAALAAQLTACLSGMAPQVEEPVAAALAGMAADFCAAFPAADRELAMRMGPLVEQWESRGPGLWHALAKRTDLALKSFAPTVHVVLPVCGGAGVVQPDQSVRIEGVLANPHANLPETVRLAYLMAAARLPAWSSPDLVRATLEAAEHVEWARADEPTLQLALTAWRVERGEANA